VHAIQAELVTKGADSNDFIMVREKGILYRLPLEGIIYISSHGKKALVHTEDKAYEISESMKHIMEKLPAANFMRIHNQFIVNMKYISHVRYYLGGRYLLHLKDKNESTLPVGIKYTKGLKERLKI
jgi:DNA-binding LytR/AlgR family response regulator